MGNERQKFLCRGCVRYCTIEMGGFVFDAPAHCTVTGDKLEDQIYRLNQSNEMSIIPTEPIEDFNTRLDRAKYSQVPGGM